MNLSIIPYNPALVSYVVPCIRYFHPICLFYTDNYPPLTDRHVYNAFKSSGVSIGQVMQLASLLNIPRDERESLQLQQRTDPATCAMLTIHQWKKQDPLPLQSAYERLDAVLTDCHLNNVKRRLHSLNQCNEIGINSILTLLLIACPNIKICMQL